jgi:hypothetical protein
MWLEKNNSVLRLALNAPHDIPCVEHEAFLAEVALRTTHSIRIYERFFRWTCVPYALGFAKDPGMAEKKIQNITIRILPALILQAAARRISISLCCGV